MQDLMKSYFGTDGGFVQVPRQDKSRSFLDPTFRLED